MPPSNTRTTAGKDLLPNEREVTYERIQEFIQRNKASIIAVCILVIASAGVIAARQIQKDNKTAEADAALAAAQTPEALENISQTYADTEAGLFASLVIADRYYQQGAWVKAAQAFQRIVDHHTDSPLAPSARIGLAAILESTGKMDEAVKAYKSVARDYPSSFQAPQSQFSAARVLETQGKLQDARQAYEELITSFPSSAWKSEADERVNKLDTMLKIKQTKPAS